MRNCSADMIKSQAEVSNNILRFLQADGESDPAGVNTPLELLFWRNS